MTTTQTPQTGSPVYIGGPMFSTADLSQQADIDSVLTTHGYTTYLPQRDGIEVAAVMADVNAGFTLAPDQVAEIVVFVHKIVFALDIYQLVVRCQSLVFNMDGRVPDDGSVSETAIGFATNKPVVTFKTTPITMLGGSDNPLVQGLSTQWAYVNDVAAIPTALDAAIAAEVALNSAPFQPGARLAGAAALGEAIWNQMDAIRKASGATPAEIYAFVQSMEKQLKPLMDKVFL